MSWVDVTTAVGTAGAAAVALGLGLRGIYLDRLRKRDEELRQARLVMIGEPSFVDATSEHSGGNVIKVYNYSDEPIHDVSVSIAFGEAKILRCNLMTAMASTGIFWLQEENAKSFFESRGGSIAKKLTFLDSSGRRFKRSSAQAAPQRILHEPQLVIQIIDGKAAVTVKPQETRIKTIFGKVTPWKSRKR